MCVYGEAHKRVCLKFGYQHQERGGGEGRESSGSMLTIQIFGHLRT